ncbi:nitrous oxide-stimulated promoter family protein [uncultured Brachyspira sp.]|uniref:nitrous oxide-stimulated promoter family protein n=1 Tax=uncultured Brachyspira sp. TaxID=221953 RepID=UPI0025937FAE|nr:nitrous oxide-stimulated promoter family protein [uncultured Brachyspira sp.]
MKSKNYKTKKIKDKIEKEKSLVFLMIKIFCKSNHKNNNLCKECIELYNYASNKIDRCRFMETKTFCSACPSHCYKKDMREKIREVMIFSGKRMIFYRPILALKHLFITLKSKRKLNSIN